MSSSPELVEAPILLAHYYAIPTLIEEVRMRAGSFYAWDRARAQTLPYQGWKLTRATSVLEYSTDPLPSLSGLYACRTLTGEDKFLFYDKGIWYDSNVPWNTGVSGWIGPLSRSLT